jgi:hypothetical protein
MHALALDWYQVKLFVQHASGFGMDALHVIAGTLLLFAVALLLRTTVARPLPLLIVLLVGVINEASDFRLEIWPQLEATLIFLIARYRPRLVAYKSS